MWSDWRERRLRRRLLFDALLTSWAMKERREIKPKYEDVWETANQAVGGGGRGRVEPPAPASIRKQSAAGLEGARTKKIHLIHATTGMATF